MSRAGSQLRTLVDLLARLRPHWRREPGLPARIDQMLRGDRRLGSSDRRLYREMVYTALRYLPWIEPLLDTSPEDAVARIAWLASETPATQAFRAAAAQGLPPCPPSVEARAAVLGERSDALFPGWLRAECPEAYVAPLLDSLLSRPPLWLRLQSEPDKSLAEFDSLGWPWRRSALVPGAVALPSDAAVSRTEAYLSGRVEIQDAGSQRVLESAGVVEGEHWLDACAGAGGKTLQLASLLGPSGHVTATDLREAPLEELRARARRAGLDGRITVGARQPPQNGYDGVLVDAPCSGSGTWRRSPHLKWTTDAAQLDAAASLQRALILQHLGHLRPGGRLVYATCSICRTENASVIESLGDAPHVQLIEPGLSLMPDTHDGDGFFVAVLRRT